MSHYLTDNIVKEILKTRVDGYLLKRESHTIEFKQSFDWDNKPSRAGYIKSIAAFANKAGGYLVFGVSNSPRKIIGISETFSTLDDAVISQALNQYLSHCPDFERDEFIVEGKKVGIIYVYRSEKKPIVCIKDFTEKLAESAIYFRYNSKSSMIKSGDLIHLLKEAKENETRKWMQIITQASTLGVHNVGIFNSSNGELSTSKGNRFILDEKLLKKLQVINQYSVQKDGAEVVRIIGEIDKAGTIIKQPISIHDDDILEGFLLNHEINSPEQYINAMCYQSSGQLPIYFYLKKANWSIQEGIKYLKSVNKNSPAKTKLLSRLIDDNSLLQQKANSSITANTPIGRIRKQFYDGLITEAIGDIDTAEKSRRVLEAVLNLDPGGYPQVYVKLVLKNIFDKFYTNSVPLGDLIRRAISFLDLIENRE